MQIYEIIFIVIIVGFVVFVFGREIYKKKKNLPTGECSCCHSNSKRLLKNYRKKYGKKKCSCSN